MRIAIIDNDKFFVMVMGGIVRMWGYQLEVFDSCESVLARHDKESFNLLIMGLDSKCFQEKTCEHMREISLRTVATTAIEVAVEDHQTCERLGIEIIAKNLAHNRIKEILNTLAAEVE